MLNRAILLFGVLAPCRGLVVTGTAVRARTILSRAPSVSCGLFDFLNQGPAVAPEDQYKQFIPDDIANPADFSVEELNALKAAR